MCRKSRSHRRRTAFSQIGKNSIGSASYEKTHIYLPLGHPRNLDRESTVDGSQSRIDVGYGLKTTAGMRVGTPRNIWMRMDLGMAIEEAVRMDKKRISAKKHCEKYQQKPGYITRSSIHTVLKPQN